MDYFRLFKVGKVAYQTIGKGARGMAVLKAVAKPAAEFVLASVVGTIVENALTKAVNTYILKETE